MPSLPSFYPVLPLNDGSAPFPSKSHHDSSFFTFFVTHSSLYRAVGKNFISLAEAWDFWRAEVVITVQNSSSIVIRVL